MPAKLKASSETTAATIGFKTTLSLAVNKPHNNIDAAKYKPAVRGLIFLKYISDSLEKHRAKQLTQEKLAEFASFDPPYISGTKRSFRNPGMKNLTTIAKALGITASEHCKGVKA